MSAKSPSPLPSTDATNYFRTTPLLSQTSSASTNGTPKSFAVKPLNLHFSGKDLPEPDARSRASYAIVYVARETPLDDPQHPQQQQQQQPSSFLVPLSSSSKLSSKPPTHLSTHNTDSTDSSPRSPRPTTITSSKHHHHHHHHHPTSSTPPSSSPQPPIRNASSHMSSLSQDLPERAFSSPIRGPRSTPILLPPTRAATAPRAPHRAASNVAPPRPTVHIDRHGTRLQRSAWTKVGTTEVARKQGRDVEFARSFHLDYTPGQRLVVRLAFFDCTSPNVERQRLIGTSEFYLSSAYAADCQPVSFPLKFLPITKLDYRRSSRIPNGTLVVVAQHMTSSPSKYRLDVECNRILRSASLSTAAVKRIFFTVHAILDNEPSSDIWTLMFRSETVQMIHKKRDGGSLEYNYFSSRRLRAAPGVILEEQIKKESNEVSGLKTLLRKAFGIGQKDCFFSLPGADLSMADTETRLKLSLFEDNGLSAGYHLIADTCFSISELQHRELGESSAIKVHANVVGRAELKYVEIASEPRYFCLALIMQGVR